MRLALPLSRRFRHVLAMRALATLAVITAGAACTPYAVHTTARPLVRGESSRNMLLTVVPGGAELDSTGRDAASVPSIDYDYRIGLDDRSDVGLRINAMSGGIITWRRRLDGPSAAPGAATAILVGGGFVNMGQHAHAEATLIRSGATDGAIIPYGGLRLIQVAPLSSAPSDRPTIGALGGARLTETFGGIGLELGVFYDRSTLGMRRGDLVVVPSISFQRGRGRNRR